MDRHVGSRASQTRRCRGHRPGTRLLAGKHPAERMTAGSEGSSGPAGTRDQGGRRQAGLEVEAAVPAQRAASGVLADRMAAALVHREPGWQLPRRSALARRYNVSMAEIDAAIV